VLQKRHETFVTGVSVHWFIQSFYVYDSTVLIVPVLLRRFTDLLIRRLVLGAIRFVLRWLWQRFAERPHAFCWNPSGASFCGNTSITSAPRDKGVRSHDLTCFGISNQYWSLDCCFKRSVLY